jgi:cytochrome c-type biogenesis protein CcmH
MGALFVALTALAASARQPTLESIGNQVMCVCGGCVAPLGQCPHLDCGTKAEMKAYIQKEIADGKDETAILQDLTLRYGVQVLTAPPVKGFNLAVWILPGVGLLVGLAVVVVVVRRWRRKPDVVVARSNVPIDAKTLAAVEAEIKSAGLG